MDLGFAGEDFLFLNGSVLDDTPFPALGAFDLALLNGPSYAPEELIPLGSAGAFEIPRSMLASDALTTVRVQSSAPGLRIVARPSPPCHC
ncbi:hypothetical protein ACRE_034670 [Hapsidospora chrysogenum ATCC 11550]|uniref:Uncharacterized protein n=1 Tax=Hapsidospora chrysogenum (strain ATCC 11550 / CBS 779.69 / DSM 880 / IAM 14645 / JCM 23072 / IMI 49137) TaxID=857340 RepID=A0A086T8N8_HAPC1|nr:hypothetical protein ACRE_034670 [Hapsidospora chrysogenum ATCC 11550]